MALVAILLCVNFSSCEKEPILTLSVQQITAPSSGNSTKVLVNANNPWTVSGNDWCTVSPSSGEGGEVSVTVTVKENTTYNDRNCTLTFTSEGLMASISVSQESNYGIVLPKDTYNVSSDAQQISVEVKANVEYDITIDAGWIKQSSTKALTSKTFTFDIEKNSTYDNREGIITIKEKNGNDIKTIKVKQVQVDAIIISSKEYSLSSKAQSLEVKLQTNVDLDIVIPDNAKTWVSHNSTKALSDKTVIFDIKENEDYSARSCEIILKKRNDAYADTIKIEQAQKDAIILSQKEYKLSSEKHTLEVKLQTNVDIDVNVPESAKSWISMVETKALVDTTIVLYIKENTDYSARNCDVIITQNNSSIADTIKIEQAQKDVVYVSKDIYNVKALGEVIEVKVVTNVDYEVVIPSADWINQVESKAAQTQSLYFKVDENKDDKDRQEIIILKNQEKDLSDTIKIIQGYIPYLTFAASAKQNLTMTKAVSTLEYSVNNGDWAELGMKTIHFGGDLGKLKIRGKSLEGTATGVNRGEFSTIVFANNEKVSCSGDLRTLVDYEDHASANTSEARFYALFTNCTNLITAPELPATTLATRCYEEMFYGCSSLLAAPELPAKTLASNCYHYMFYGCTNLSTAYDLPATTLAPYCYCYMFYGTNLTVAPKLPATILERYCYAGMFKKCSKLNQITMLAMDVSAQQCLSGWVEGVPPTGTFIKTAAMFDLPQGSDGIPEWWTVKNYVE